MQQTTYFHNSFKNTNIFQRGDSKKSVQLFSKKNLSSKSCRVPDGKPYQIDN